VECAAIALDRLGETIDIQGGGSDLIFPHHEHSAACAELATGHAPFAAAYVHAGMVALDGEKMSKSRGNLVFVSTLLRDGVEPAAIRLAILDHHYREDWEWTAADLNTANQRLARWRAAVAGETARPAEPLLHDVRRNLSNDLATPQALAAIDKWATDPPADIDPAAPQLATELLDALLGIQL
jgi:L-cysteine:1D-myo-inositol 2-amino-2-deoxy-alpha-D-glucopyranoside ligase